MNVYGHAITEAQIQKILNITIENEFSFNDAVDIAIEAGVPVDNGEPAHSIKYVASRAVDRILQKEKKAGRITFENKKWRTIK
jgi:hypothetical protein